MNKYQEALDKVKNIVSCATSYKDPFTYSESTELNKQCNALQELVDKSTPKMFKIKKDTDGKIIYVCPNCGRVLVKFWSEIETITMYNYCDNCGQALKYME